MKQTNSFKEVTEKCKAELTDIIAGPMTINELYRELYSLMLHRSPEYAIILIEKRKDLKKYHSTIYITHKDFKKYR